MFIAYVSVIAQCIMDETRKDHSQNPGHGFSGVKKRHKFLTGIGAKRWSKRQEGLPRKDSSLYSRGVRSFDILGLQLYCWMVTLFFLDRIEVFQVVHLERRCALIFENMVLPVSDVIPQFYIFFFKW